MSSGPNPKTSIVFFGNERLVSGLDHTDAPVLTGLIERGYDVQAVVSHHSETKSRRPKPLEVAELAEAHSIPVFLPNRPIDIYQELMELHADMAILVAYGRIIPQRVIDLFPLGIVNIHPSLLPKYRGPTPIETPIARQETETGVSIMQLSIGMDEGPVYVQHQVVITPDETKFTLYNKLAHASSELLFDTLPSIIDGSLQPKPQNNQAASYCQLLERADGLLRLDVMTAAEADAHVRAYLGFPGSRTMLGDIEVIITSAHVSDTPTPLSIACADSNYLVIDTLKPVGKKEMPAKAFLSGYGSRL
jgi:methionyl-tRNA formyltransferase